MALSFWSLINTKFSKKISEFFPNNMQANEANEMKLIFKKIKVNKNKMHEKMYRNIRDYSPLYYI